MHRRTDAGTSIMGIIYYSRILSFKNILKLYKTHNIK
jgi:hypothetical protein